ncbi:bath-38, partial [Symbiodinium sp. KB8]
VVFIHDFSCFGGQLELVGRPEDIKAVEKGRLLGQQVLWHPPRAATAEKAAELWREGTESTDCASDLRKDPLPVRGWFDGRTLTWEQRPMRHGQGIAEHLKEGDDWLSSGAPAITQLPEGPWVRITSALEPEGIPGPDCGLWTYQASFYAECHGALPVQFLDRLGEYQAGPGSTELFLRSKRHAGPKEVDFGDDWDSEDDEDFSLEILGLVDVPKKVDFQVPPATATSEEVSDLLLDFGGDTMPAVSQLLRLASPVFNRMLVSNMKEAQKSIIKVEVASKTEFKIFYDLLEPCSWSKDKISKANVDALLAISDYYQVDVVKQGCEQFLLGLPATGDRLLQAHKHGLNKQYQRCIVSIAEAGTKDDLLVLHGHPDVLLE